MRAFLSLRHLILPCAAALLSLTAVASCAKCAEARAQQDAVVCPRTLFLQTATVRVFETSEMAENMLHASCVQASQRALAIWQAQAKASANSQTRACAARMGAQGCLMGQPFTQPHCTSIMCPLTQTCTVTLVRLDPSAVKT